MASISSRPQCVNIDIKSEMEINDDYLINQSRIITRVNFLSYLKVDVFKNKSR